MPLNLLFFVRDAVEPPGFEALADALTCEPGLTLDGNGVYAQIEWRHPDTRASCVGDLGTPPVEADTLHPPRRYDGWREAGLVLHLPLAVPHWHCVETMGLIERLCARLPGLALLDTEDTATADGEGPGPLSRPRLLASWERQHADQTSGLEALPRMDRHASIALWRYRRERLEGRRRHDGLDWPEALVLDDGGTARSACLWPDPEQPLALPPVELAVLLRPDSAGVLPTDEVLAAAGGGTPLGLAAAVFLAPSPALTDLFLNAHPLPADRFKALGDDDWSD